MKIAVTYDNGSVFQHFGKTENFKIFEVENGAIISSEVVGSNGAGPVSYTHLDAVLFNAGAAIYTAREDITIEDGIKIAREALESGLAAKQLDDFAKATKQ